jgi:antirestriction protein ArdC
MSDYQTTAQSRDVYQKVTDAIVKAIEQGAGQYRMPWVVRQDKGFSPISVSTVKPYRGVNTLVLWAQSQSKGYTSALWGTYQQWQSLGGQVRKGEHGSPVVYWGTYESKGAAEDEQDERSGRHLFCKGYTVFNLDQVDGVKLPKRFEPELSQNQRIARADSFFAGVGVQVRDGGNRAFYRRTLPRQSICPDSISSRSEWTTTPRLRTKPRIGLRTCPVAIANWASGSAMPLTPWKS